MLTVTEWEKLNPTPLSSGVVEIFASENPVLAAMPFINVQGNSYRYNVEDTLPGIAFRSIGEGYTESTGVVNPEVESLTICGGDSDFDVAQIEMGTGDNDTRAVHLGMKAKALTLAWLNTFFNGDTSVNPKAFDGINKRLTGGTQEFAAGANGAVLTLDMLDELVDKVRGTPSLILCNKAVRRKIRQLARSTNALSITRDFLGREVDAYAGVPLGVVEEGADGDEILGFTETQGTANNTTSLYAVKFGADMMHGIQTKPMTARDLGEISEKPCLRSRIEWYSGLVIKHPKAVSRLKGIKAA